MSVLYVDTSALLKRVVKEAESSAVAALLSQRHSAGDLLTASSLAWVEVWRALRRGGAPDVEAAAGLALSGIAEHPLDELQLHRARRVGPESLRSLDAIHLAAAIAVGADSVVTYDLRLAEAASSAGLAVLAP
ncbi:Predicted nucleic acid-binding protein, contains PIN domain [Frankineae bacterium MT45]|nr:Predicted nucleic acid-binding protein, contains PIN domain [Frankineae bacterium MT45]